MELVKQKTKKIKKLYHKVIIALEIENTILLMQFSNQINKRKDLILKKSKDLFRLTRINTETLKFNPTMRLATT